MGRLSQDLEEMRVRLRDNAEEKLRYDKESKELISNISHDLKTPVTAIKGYAEGIMDGVADTPEKMQKYIRTIYNKADEMNTLINELTFYSKIDTNRIPYNFNTLSVNDYFEDCAEDLSLELEAKNVEFGYFNYVEKDVKVIADAEQIKRVIHNIVNNSLKYMDKPKAKINLRVKDVGDFVQVELEDNGKGIAAKDLPNIFDRFYRTDASRNSSKGGSGIGLSIVKKILRSTEARSGRPAEKRRERPCVSCLENTRRYRFMSKILIVEDEEAIADLEKDYLELSGFQVEVATDGETGLKRAMEGEFDLYILDLMLPGVDGFDICRQIRNEKNTPIIMVSAKKDDIDKIRAWVLEQTTI